MTILVAANALVVAVTLWAVWERRLTFQSRWDFPNTAAITLFGAGAVLDSPLRAMSEASFASTGRYYLLVLVGHACYLGACVMGNKAVYLRLLPDSTVDRLIKGLVRAVWTAVAVMAVALLVSPRSRLLTADHLYQVDADGWLTLYWMTYYGATTALIAVAMYGVSRLRRDHRSVMMDLLALALILGLLSSVGSAIGVLNGWNETTRLWAWPILYAAIIAGMVALVASWRHRVGSMLRPAG